MRLPATEDQAEGPNLTPVIDMVFLLLIFFLCATQFNQEERELDTMLPEVVQAQPLTMPPQELIVNFSRDGVYRVQGKSYNERQLGDLLQQVSQKNPGTQSVLIRGDGDADWEMGVRVMGLCNRAKIRDYRVAALQEAGSAASP